MSLVVSDGYDSVTYNWTVDVQNLNVAQIQTVNPNNALTIIPSVGSQTFTTTAIGTPPIDYQWKLNGADIAGETNFNINLSTSNLAVGDYTLEIEVNDANSTSDSRTMAIRMNAMPSIDSFTLKLISL